MGWGRGDVRSVAVLRGFPPLGELVLGPLDRLRNGLLKAFSPVSGVLAGRRELRVAVVGSASIALCFALTIAAPLWLLAVGPIVLGVPHLLADVRYCVVRPGWHRRPALIAAVGLPLVVGAMLHEPAVSLAGLAGVAAAARGALWRRVLVLATALLGAAAVLWWPRAALPALLHAHNFVGVALWWAWRQRQSRLHAVPLGLFVMMCVFLLASSALAPVPGATAGLGTDVELGRLAPGLSPALGTRLVLLFCFAQSVHYVIWLRLVPEDDRTRVSPRTFRASWRALLGDVGPVVVLSTIVGAIALAVWAAIDVADARDSYLRFAGFHVVLELCAAGMLLVEGRPGGRSSVTTKER